MSTMTREESERVFLPGMGLHWLLPLYDPLTRLLGVDRSRRTLLENAALRSGDRVLDVGCGTGSLAIGMKLRHPQIQVAALDPDAKALARARRKAEGAGVAIQFERGFADALPYPDRFFDFVFSSFMFHHLERGEKQGMLSEVGRVLKPGGTFCLLDFSELSSSARHSAARQLRDNAKERVVALMTESGLVGARNVGTDSLLAGLLPIARYQASAGTSGLG